MAASEGTTRTIKGSCLCGHITYTASIPSEPLTANRCNCAFCRKRGMTTYNLPDPSSFALLTPASTAEIGDYQPRGSGHRWFCAACGVHVWQEAQYEIQGHQYNLFAVNLATMEQPQTGIDLNEVTINYVDGLHDNFMEKSSKPFAGGLA